MNTLKDVFARIPNGRGFVLADKEKTGGSLSPIATGVVGSITGTLIGLAIGGPIGAIAGAATGPLATFAGEALAKRFRKAEIVLEIASDMSGESKDDFLIELSKDERKVDATSGILNAAANAHYKEKLTSLAVLLADVRHEKYEELDKYFIMIPILDFIEPPHVEILRFVFQRNSENADQLGCEPEEIMNAFPHYNLIIRSIVRMLELHGLMTDKGELDPVTYRGRVYWVVAPLGVALLQIFERQPTSSNG